jgi:hypothetical protein
MASIGRRLLAAGLLLAAGAPGLDAETTQAAIRVSVQVVRSCRVTTGGAEVALDCGSRPESVLVAIDSQPSVSRVVSAPTPVAPATAALVTIHF